MISAVTWPSEPAEIEQCSQFLDDAPHRTECYQSRETQRHSRGGGCYRVSWFSRTVPPGLAPGEIRPDTARGVFNGLHRVREMEDHQEMDERIRQLELSLSDK